MKLIIDTTSALVSTNINLTHFTEPCNGCTISEYQIIKACQSMPEDYSIDDLLAVLLNTSYPKPAMRYHGKVTVRYHDPLSGDDINISQLTTEYSNLIWVEISVPGLRTYTGLAYEGSRGRFKEILDVELVKYDKLLIPSLYQSSGPEDMKWYEDRNSYIQRVTRPGNMYALKDLFDDVAIKQIKAQQPDRNNTDIHFLSALSAEDYKEFEEAIYNLTAIIDRISGVNKMVVNDPDNL